MKTHTGIWISRKTAFILHFDPPDKDLEMNLTAVARIESGIKGGASINRTPWGTQEVIMENRMEHQPHQFYKKIINATTNSTHIMIMGPGKSKTELRNEFEVLKNGAARYLFVEEANNMTEREIAARVQEHFSLIR